MNFCRALCDTVHSGLPLSEAFEILSRSRKYGRFLAGAEKLTAGGSRLHEAFAAQKVFPPVFTALVRAGEEGGKTEEFLSLYADCLEIRIDFRRRLLRAMVYPAFTILLAAALLGFAMIKVVPTLLGSFFTSGTPVPQQLLWITALPGYLSEHWPPAVLIFCAAATAVRALMRSSPGRRLASLAGHWLPVFRFAAMEARLYHIYTIIGLLFKAGLAPGAMMDVMLQFSQDDPVTRRRFSRAAAMLSSGKSFAESLGPGLPGDDLRSLEIAERAGRLDETLLRLGKVHYDRHLHRLKLLMTGFKITSMVAIAALTFLVIAILIRPVMRVVMGAGILPAQQAAGTPSERTRSPGSGQAPADTHMTKAPETLFNQVYGKKVSNLIGNSAAGAKQPPKLRSGQSRLGQGFRLKPRKFQKPVPAENRNSDPSSAR